MAYLFSKGTVFTVNSYIGILYFSNCFSKLKLNQGKHHLSIDYSFFKTQAIHDIIVLLFYKPQLRTDNELTGGN